MREILPLWFYLEPRISVYRGGTLIPHDRCTRLLETRIHTQCSRRDGMRDRERREIETDIDVP